jgi:hypothetical protein
MRRHRQRRRGFAPKIVATRRLFVDVALADGDDTPFEEREFETAAGTDEKYAAASDIAAK